MDSPRCILAGYPAGEPPKAPDANEASAPFEPTYPLKVLPFCRLLGSKTNYKTVFGARFYKSEVPAEVFLAGHFRCLIPLATQLLCQPLCQVIPKATGINEIFPSARTC